MFSFLKSLQWRLVFIFITMIIVLMSVVYVILNRQVESWYYDRFKSSIERGLRQEWDISENPTQEELLDYLKEQNYAKVLFLISDEKPYTIYNYVTHEVIYTSDIRYDITDEQQKSRLRSEIESSPNTIAARVNQIDGIGGEKNLVRLNDTAFFDFAVRKGDFILYFRNYRDEWLSIIRNFNDIIISSVFFASIASLIIGYMLSKTITVPIENLMRKAERIASGNFDQMLPVKSEDEIGKLTRTFNYMASELKKTLTEISSEKSKIETILNCMTDGVIAFDISGKIIHINPAAKRILGQKEYSKSFNEFSKEYRLGVLLEDFLYLDSATGKECDISVDDKYLRVYFEVFTDENKKPEGIIVVIHDITEQERLDKMRREFVANVSHELRTPLTSIKSYSETLLDGALDDRETAENFLKVIDSEAERMTRLVKDLLQLSSLDNKQLTWDIRQFSFVELVKGCIEKMKFEALNKSQELECYVIGELPVIKADRDKIEQVVLNILSNAIKYTPEKGKITVYMGRIYREVYVKVVDTGIGIPKEDISRICERFYRVDKARSREMGGTGLGLSIVKEIVEAHGGSILINSELGKGTEVTVKLPIEVEV